MKLNIKILLSIFLSSVLLVTSFVNVFASSASETTVIWPNENSFIYDSTQKEYMPDGYIELEYIRRTGTGNNYIYFKTDVNTTDDMEFVFDAILENNSYSRVFGTYVGNTSGPNNYLYQSASAADGGFHLYHGTNAAIKAGTNAAAVAALSGVRRTYDVKLKSGDSFVKIDGTQYYSDTQTINVNSNEIYLMTLNRISDRGGDKTLTLYSMKIYQDGELIRDYIPAIHIVDGKIGLWDKINNNFNPMLGTGSYEIGNVVDTNINSHFIDLYKNYSLYDYVKTDGNSYFDTGYNATPNSKLIFDFAIASNHDDYSGYSGIAGARNAISNKWSLWFFYSSRQMHESFKSDSSTDVNFGDTITNDDRLLVTMDSSSGINLVRDGSTIGTYSKTYTNTSNDLDILLSATNATSTMSYSILKIYGAKLYEGTSLVRDLLPVKRKSDSKFGLYDLVTGTFIDKSGGGTISGGTEIAKYYEYEDYQKTDAGDYISKVINPTILYELLNTTSPTLQHDWHILENKMVPTVNNYSGYYDGNFHSISITSVKNLKGENISNYTISYSEDGSSYSSTNPSYKDIGTYTVYYKIVDNDSKYTTYTSSATVKINRKPINIPNTGIKK